MITSIFDYYRKWKIEKILNNPTQPQPKLKWQKEVLKVIATLVGGIFLIYMPIMYIQENFDLVLQIKHQHSSDRMYVERDNQSAYFSYFMFMVFLIKIHYIKKTTKYFKAKDKIKKEQKFLKKNYALSYTE